ncbi:hypothetical protein MFIFM68171_07358 [Madurella fahalii]|uniref:DUF6594 domain-containing protein n=1 Tax=Madurella fahalii TaxID=1157608 RepID=A0ABQ0GHB2_9PEZI
MERLRSILSSLCFMERGHPTDVESQHEGWELRTSTQIESYRQGYPQYTALLAASDSFYVFRKFSRARARLLLLKQDKISVLEKELDRVDREEQSPLFLGKSRFDANANRAAVLAELDTALIDYDSLLERSHRIMSLKKAPAYDTRNLQNWVIGTGSLDRDETSYLGHEDLVSLVPPGDNATARLESWIENALIWSYKGFRQCSGLSISSNPNVYIYSGSLIRRLTRVVILIVTIALLLTPVVVCNSVPLVVPRISIVVLSSAVFLFVLDALMRVRTFELVLAGATYVTVLTVFVSRTVDSSA